MKLLWKFLSAYPRRSIVVILAMLVAGLAEGLSLSTLLPSLSMVGGDAPQSALGVFIVEKLKLLNITPGIGVLLGIVVGGVVIRSILLLITNRQVGYSVAGIATSLRLALIDALLASRWQFYLSQHTCAHQRYRH